LTSTLVNTCEQLIFSGNQDILNSVDFLNTDFSTLKRLISSNYFSYLEIDIFKTCVRWSEHQSKQNGSDLKFEMNKIIQFIRFPLIDVSDLGLFVFPFQFLTEGDLNQLFLFSATQGKVGDVGKWNKNKRNITYPEKRKEKYTELIVDKIIELESKEHHFKSVIVKQGGVLTVEPWNGIKGGLLVLNVSESVKIESGGSIDVTGKGYRGGSSAPQSLNSISSQGESISGTGSQNTQNNSGGGGGGLSVSTFGSVGGGGGGYATQGQNAEPNTYNGGNNQGGQGGTIYGSDSTINFGSGGGGGSPFWNCDLQPAGGNGGGSLVIISSSFDNEGKVCSNGQQGGSVQGGYYCSSGGGGSGGSILIETKLFKQSTSSLIEAVGGTPGPKGDDSGNPGVCSRGGEGGSGRITIICGENIQHKQNIKPLPNIISTTKPTWTFSK
jgi:hypothetical protein